jgi:hypothetical protein
MDKTEKFLHRLPRILSILFILFLSLFSLDVFEPGKSFREIAIGLFMHNIPSLVMIVVLIISWRNDVFGAIGFIGAGLIYMAFVVMNTTQPWYIALTWGLSIAAPAFLIGILYLMSWRTKTKAT